MENIYLQLTRSRIKAAVEAARALKGTEHPGLKGQLREIVIRDLLRPLFPADIGVGTGEIITADGYHSPQQDVVVFDRRILPPILFEQTSGFFPLESVLVCIEVKSTLTASELKTAHTNALELESLHSRYLAGKYSADDTPQRHIGQHLVPCLFAFESDLTGSRKSEVERYDETRGTGTPAIKAICVVGKGYWDWKEGAWGTLSNITYPYGEVVAFVSVILNSYKIISQSRGEPRLGCYMQLGDYIREK
jgi:hypothetical protein